MSLLIAVILGKMTFKGTFKFKPLCDSMILESLQKESLGQIMSGLSASLS